MKKYPLIRSAKYDLVLLLDDKEFDYYTDITIELDIRKEKIILFKDNLLYLKNIVKQYEKGPLLLSDNLKEDKLGILLNEYYKYLNDNHPCKEIVLNEKNEWIGQKYNCFSTLNYATWLYRYDKNIILMVTPIFSEFDEENYISKYSTFINNYKDIFRECVTLPQLKRIGNIIINLYNKLLQ